MASFLGSLPSRVARLAKRSGRAAKARIPKPKPAPKPTAAKPAAAGAAKADEDRVISVGGGRASGRVCSGTCGALMNCTSFSPDNTFGAGRFQPIAGQPVYVELSAPLDTSVLVDVSYRPL